MSAGGGWLAAASVILRAFPQPGLAAAGLAALALAPVGALWAAIDTRRVDGEGVALKPTRFALSIGLYLLTVCWMLGYAEPGRLSSPLVEGVTAGLLAGAGVEMLCIVLQAARGRRSHLNLATPFDAAVSVIMGVTSLLFVGMLLPLAWEIACRPRPDASPVMVWAIVVGLAATFGLGALTGAGMAQTAAGDTPGRPLRLPLFGEVRGGSGRVAHFLGVHGLQAFPLIAGAALEVGERAAAAVSAVGATGYVAATMLLLAHSVSGVGGVAPVSKIAVEA